MKAQESEFVIAFFPPILDILYPFLINEVQANGSLKGSVFVPNSSSPNTGPSCSNREIAFSGFRQRNTLLSVRLKMNASSSVPSENESDRHYALVYPPIHGPSSTLKSEIVVPSSSHSL